MMGNPAEMNAADQQRIAVQKNTKATFSGMTALISVVALIITIISVAVPHWGTYAPPSGFDLYSEATGHFGPFQVCKNSVFQYSCGSGTTQYRTTTWLTLAGVFAILEVVALTGMSVFSMLQVAMQLQRREIMFQFQRTIFLKVISASVAAMCSLIAVILGAVEFQVNFSNRGLNGKMGVCYYLQIILIFVNVLLVILSVMSYKKVRSHPPLMVSKQRQLADDHHIHTGATYDVRNSNGVAMTMNSGLPYQSTGGYVHGQPRFPINSNASSCSTASTAPSSGLRYPPQYNAIQEQVPHDGMTSQPYYMQQQQYQVMPPQPGPQQPPIGQVGQSTNGFTPVSLVVPSSSNPPQYTDVPIGGAQNQPLTIRPIQPVQPIQIPQASVSQVMVGSSGGVSFVPGGRNAKLSVNPAGHGGSIESLNSTQSLTLSNLSFDSTTSTGSSHGPLRSSLKKEKKQRDQSSVTSETSSKRVRYGLGGEQTSV